MRIFLVKKKTTLLESYLVVSEDEQAAETNYRYQAARLPDLDVTTDPQTEVTEITETEVARDLAIQWQRFMSERSISYQEIYEEQDVMERIGEVFGLTEEFLENGLI